MLSSDAHTLDTGSVSFSIDGSGARSQIVGASYRTTARGRFWSISAERGDQRDVAIHSEHQRARVTRADDSLLVSYDQLVTVTGEILDVQLQVTIAAVGDDLVFSAAGKAGEEVSLSELRLPVIELAPKAESEREVLYRAEGLGRRITNPRVRLAQSHSEYMRDDASGIWEQAAYPGDMSMAWQGVELDEDFLYLARHDLRFRGALFAAGVPRRDVVGELWLAVVTPMDRHEIDTGEIVVSALKGGWRAAARRYREWADSTWYSGPPAGAEKLRGWQRIIMRHQFGAVQFTYDDLVPIFELGRQHGLDGILLFGWWKAGFDRGYPVYEPDEALGGAEALFRAAHTINERGGFLSLYANGNIIDRCTAYYADHGEEITKKDSRGLDYVAGYDFAGESLSMRHFAAPSFTAVCHGAPRWRDQMASVAELQASLGAKSVFFDQTGFHLIAWPCYDERHDHGTHVNEESRFRAATFRQVREASNGATLGSEGMADFLIPLLDFHHGCGYAFQFQLHQDEAFPGMFRTVFPEPVVSNRLIHDQRSGWEQELYYAFAYNLVFDVAIHRSRSTLDAAPEYASLLTRLVALRREHAATFNDGAFELVEEGSLVHTRYTTAQERVDIYWNRGALPLGIDERIEVRPLDLAVVASRR